jgi:hypothetical protein
MSRTPDYWSTGLTVYAVLAPVAYALLAGRASMNLWDTDQWHRWANVVFMSGLLLMLGLWFTSRPEFFCE